MVVVKFWIFLRYNQSFSDGLDVGCEKKRRQDDAKVFGATRRIVLLSTVRWGRFS